MKNYEELEVWQKANALTARLYEATAPFPRAEMFGLTSEIRCGGGSIGANLESVISNRQMRAALLQTLRRTRNTPPTTPANGGRRMANSGVIS